MVSPLSFTEWVASSEFEGSVFSPYFPFASTAESCYLQATMTRATGRRSIYAAARGFAVIHTEATLVAQPRGAELEYRIIAVNKAGESPPSNTVEVVL